MSNRNFDSRVIIQRLRDQNNAQNLYRYQQSGIQSIRNPLNSDPSPERILSYRAGQETTYYKNLIGGGYISSIGGVANILAENVSVIQISQPSSSVPDAPIITSVIKNRPPPGLPITISIYFTAGSDGGSTIINYKYSFDNVTYNSFSPEQVSSPLEITGLSQGEYNISIKAVNSNGDSIASNTVTAITG